MRPVKTPDYQRPLYAAKEPHIRVPLQMLVLTLALALTGCRTAGHCLREVPEAMRADALRYALDKELFAVGHMPESELELAHTRGRPAATLSAEEASRIRPWAMRYSHCMRDE